MADSVFWQDLAEDMKDPKVAEVFEQDLAEIRETDNIVNAHLAALEGDYSGEVYPYW